MSKNVTIIFSDGSNVRYEKVFLCGFMEYQPVFYIMVTDGKTEYVPLNSIVDIIVEENKDD